MNQPPSLPPEAPESLNPAPPPESTFFADAVNALLGDHGLQVLLTVILVANVAMFAYLFFRFENLPNLMPLHFDASGAPDRIESKNSIFALPIIGVTVFFLNTGLGILLHNRERAATLMLTAATLFVQILMWIAVINIAGIV